MFYGDYQFQQDRQIRIYNNKAEVKHNYVNVYISHDASFQGLTNILRNKLFHEIQHLRLFDGEGVEIFPEDLLFIKDQSVLYATNKGEDFNPAQSFQEYEILEVLGEGGFGKVMLGEHKIRKKKVAIKILDTMKVGNAQDIDMVFREADTLKALKHKNIVKVLNQYTLPNMQVVFVMEYCSGGELLSYLEQHGPLDENQAKYFFKQVAEAIHYCHQQNVIHRDLKLENILLESKESKIIKIIDFGIAGISTNMNVDKLNAGSLSYMAPEILNGQIKKIGAPIDIWALGVILYGLVTGTLPFYGNNPQEVLDKIQKFQIPQSLSIDLRDLLSLIFLVDPIKRIKMINILHHPWLEQTKTHASRSEHSKGVSISREPTKVQFNGGNKTRILKQPTSILKKENKQLNLQFDNFSLTNTVQLPKLEQTFHLQPPPLIFERQAEDEMEESVNNNNEYIKQSGQEVNKKLKLYTRKISPPKKLGSLSNKHQETRSFINTQEDDLEIYNLKRQQLPSIKKRLDMSLEKNELSNRQLIKTRISQKNLRNKFELYNPKTPSPMRYLTKIKVLP